MLDVQCIQHFVLRLAIYKPFVLRLCCFADYFLHLCAQTLFLFNNFMALHMLYDTCITKLVHVFQDSCQLAVDVMSCLLKLVILIGAIILVFGIPYAYLALDLYGGSMLSSGSGMYIKYCSSRF